MKDILITGVNGVLAGKLINLFVKDSNYNIAASTRDMTKLARTHYKVKYISNDDLISKDIIKDFDFVIHCAFPTNLEVKDMFSATQFFQTLLSKSIEMKVKNFINISSQSVYGNYREYPSHEPEAAPENIYALTKYNLECLGIEMTRCSEINYTNLRLASLIGNEFPERVINKMIKIALQTKKITVQNDKNIFGYVDADDISMAIYSFVENSMPDNWRKIYNVGGIPNSQENLEYIACIIKNLFKNINIDIQVDVNKQEKADKLCWMNSEHFYKASKWKPQFTLEKTIEKIFINICG